MSIPYHRKTKRVQKDRATQKQLKKQKVIRGRDNITYI